MITVAAIMKIEVGSRNHLSLIWDVLLPIGRFPAPALLSSSRSVAFKTIVCPRARLESYRTVVRMPYKLRYCTLYGVVIPNIQKDCVSEAGRVASPGWLSFLQCLHFDLPPRRSGKNELSCASLLTANIPYRSMHRLTIYCTSCPWPPSTTRVPLSLSCIELFYCSERSATAYPSWLLVTTLVDS